MEYRKQRKSHKEKAAEKKKSGKTELRKTGSRILTVLLVLSAAAGAGGYVRMRSGLDMGDTEQNFRQEESSICGFTELLSLTAFGAEAGEDGLLIEDDGAVTVTQEGENLEEVKAAESEAAAQEAAEAAEAEALRQQLLEDTEVQLEPASADLLAGYLTNLTSVESPIGSDGELVIAGYIESMMESYGYTISEQSFHEGFLNANGIDAPGINIIAERGADSENRTNDILVISTHYDSKSFFEENNGILGMGMTQDEAAAEDAATEPAENSSEGFANDKSGAAVLLELARILSYEETDTDICFLFFSGEEDGLYGSSSFLKSMGDDFGGRIVGDIHVERAGYTPGYVYTLGTADGAENYLSSLIQTEAIRMAGRTAAGTEGGAEVQENSDSAAAGGAEAQENTDSAAAGGADAQENPDGATAGGEEAAEAVSDFSCRIETTTAQKNFADYGIVAVAVKQYLKSELQGSPAEDTQSTTEETVTGIEGESTVQENSTGTEGENTVQENSTGTAGESTVQENAAEDMPVQPDTGSLEKVTNILAAAVYQIMSE